MFLRPVVGYFPEQMRIRLNRKYIDYVLKLITIKK